MKIIAASIAFIFALPIVLSQFIYLGFFGGTLYFILYLIFCIGFVPFSVLFLILSIFIKKIREMAVAGITVSSILIIMLSLSFIIYKLHDESEFIIGANYNKFNSEKWQKTNYYGSNQREYMLKDLAQNILPHKNIGEIIDLLGAPYAIISEEKTYNSYSNNGNTVFRSNIRDENGKIESYEEFDLNVYNKAEIKKEIMIYYITGPAFMDHSALYIYFGTDGIFKEYKYAVGST